MGNVNTLIFLVILIVAVGITTLSIFKGKNILGKNVVEGLASANVNNVKDTLGWTSTAGVNCDGYKSVGWCKDGKVVLGGGANYNYPEKNCVACGKTDNTQGDSDNWLWNNNGKYYNCAVFQKVGWCKNGNLNSSVAANPTAWNNPEKNC